MEPHEPGHHDQKIALANQCFDDGEHAGGMGSGDDVAVTDAGDGGETEIEHADIAIAFASIDPSRGPEAVREARRLVATGGIHGLKLHPPIQQFFPIDRLAYPLYEVFAEARLPVYGNVDGQPTTSAADARERLARQLTSPVRWVDLVQRLAADHPDALYVEMGPGSVLTGLVRKIAPQLAVMAVGGPPEVEQLMNRLT